MVAGGGASVIYADTVSCLTKSFPAKLMQCFFYKSQLNLHVLKLLICLPYRSLMNNNIALKSNFMVYQVGDLGYASELGNYAEYSGAPNEDEVLQYARVVLDVWIGYYIYTHIILICILNIEIAFFCSDSVQLQTRTVASEHFSLEGV